MQIAAQTVVIVPYGPLLQLSIKGDLPTWF
jgi:hypothetical protein